MKKKLKSEKFDFKLFPFAIPFRGISNQTNQSMCPPTRHRVHAEVNRHIAICQRFTNKVVLLVLVRRVAFI